MGSAGQNGWHDTAKTNGPGVVIGRSGVGSMGAVHYCSQAFWPHNTTLYVVNFCGNDPLFAYYLLATLNFRQYDSGSAQASLNRNNLYSLPVASPPLPTQRAIAHILGALDDKIELNRKTNETLEAMARALFQSWFVDFDPVRAKAAGRAPEGMDDATAKLFPSEFEQSELGEVPKGWRVGTLGSVATIVNEVVSPETAPDYEWEHFSIPAFDASREPVIELGRSIKSNKFRVPASAVLLSKLNPETSRVWLPAPERPEAAICSTEFIPLVPRSASTALLFEMLRSEPCVSRVAERAYGSTGSRQRVSPADALRVPVVLADSLDGAFSARVVPLHREVLRLRHESRTLAALRDALLPKLLSGELAIRDAERFVAGAV